MNLQFETGKLANKASGAVVVRQGDNVILATATMSSPREGIGFFPLTVDFEERHYSIGNIPGSFFRREGRPTTHAVLIDRLIDRPIRPLFPKDFKNEVQVIVTSLSSDRETLLDILALNGVSAALTISDIPFNGPIAATRIGYINEEFIVNPTYDQLDNSELDIVVASSKNGVSMMEAAALQVNEDTILRAIERAHEINLEIISLQEDFASKCGKPKSDYTPRGHDPDAVQEAGDLLGNRIYETLSESVNQEDMETRMATLKEELNEFKTMVEKSKNSYEEILDKTTKSIEKFIENAESDQEKNIQ